MSEDTARDVEGYLAPGEAGRMLGVSGTWVKKLIERGELEGIETHLGWLIRPASVEATLAKRLRDTEKRVADMKAARKQTPKRRLQGKSLKGKSLGMPFNIDAWEYGEGVAWAEISMP